MPGLAPGIFERTTDSNLTASRETNSSRSLALAPEMADTYSIRETSGTTSQVSPASARAWVFAHWRSIFMKASATGGTSPSLR
jgi:hypothetical protein